MAGVDISSFGASMIHYLPGVTPTLNMSSTARRFMQKAKDYKWEGSYIDFFVHVAMNNGMGYTEDGGAIPVAQKQDYVEAKAYRRFLVGAIQVTDGILATAATSQKAAIDVVKSELRGFTSGVADLEDFMSFRDGTGTVASVMANVSASATAVVKVNDARMCRDKARLEVYDTTLTTLKGYFTVTSTARALDTSGYFQVTGNLTAASIAGDKLVWPNSLNRAPTGLSKMVDDASTTFQNISTATYPRYTSPVLDNGGTLRALTPGLFRNIMATVSSESGEETSEWTALGSPWLGIKFEELFQDDVRLSTSDKVGGARISSFQSAYGKINYASTRHAPYNSMYFVDFEQVYRAVQKEGDFRRNSSGGIFKDAGPNLAYTADWSEICEYFIKRRNSSGRIDDLLESPQSGH